MMEALMMVATYTKSLLKDESPSDGHSKAYIRSSPWSLRSIWSHSWMIEALWWSLSIQSHSWMKKILPMVTLTAYIGSSPWRLDLHRGSHKIWKCSWRLLWVLTLMT